MRDREIVERCKRGDRLAWAELFRKQDRRLLRIFARSAPGADAMDLRQQVWLKLVEKDALARLRLERDGALDAFFARVARRVALDHRREQEPVLPGVMSGGRDPEAEAVRAEEREQLAAALCRVVRGSRRDFDILRSHLRDGLGATEIAGMGVGLTPKGVSSLLNRALPRVAAELGRPPATRAPGRAGGIRARTP